MKFKDRRLNMKLLKEKVIIIPGEIYNIATAFNAVVTFNIYKILIFF